MITGEQIKEARAWWALSDRAHSLKGASANLLAESARNAAEKLEHAARLAQTDSIPQLVIELHDELAARFEQIEQGCFAARAIKLICLADLDHR